MKRDGEARENYRERLRVPFVRSQRKLKDQEDETKRRPEEEKLGKEDQQEREKRRGR